MRHRGLWLGLALVLPCHFGSASAQAVLELDLAGGRRIVDGPELSFRNFGAVDYERRLVYAVEALEPLAVAAYSMDDGSVVRLYGGREGEGPGELLQIQGVALSEEGVFAVGGAVANHWDFSGELIYQWRPVAPGVRMICSMGVQPAVAGQWGVVVRADDGRSLALGSDSMSTAIKERTVADGSYATYTKTRMACADSVAFVLRNHVIETYRSGEPTGRIAVPPEIEEVGRQRESQRWPGMPEDAIIYPYGKLLASDQGRLVVTTLQHPEVAGAVIDPATGCYEAIKTERNLDWRHVLGMMADSLIFVEAVMEPKTELVDGERRPETRMVGGRSVPVMRHVPRAIAIRPVRLVSGERCPAP